MSGESKPIRPNPTARPARQSGGLLRLGTIRARLVISFILIVLLAGIAVSSITVVMGTRDGRQREISQLESVATLKQAEIESWIKSLQVNLNIIVSGQGELSDIRKLTQNSVDPGQYNASYTLMKYRFQWAAGAMGLFEEIFLMDTDGAVRVSTDTAHEGEKHSIYDYFTEGMKGPYIQQPSYSLSLGKMIVVISIPVLENDRTLGVISGRANLASLDQIMQERAGLGETGETYLVGSNHRLLTGLRSAPYAIPETYIRSAGADAAADNHTSGSAAYPNYNGTIVIGVYHWLPDLQVALLAEQAAEEALQGTVMALWIIVGVAAAALILAIIAARFITRSIVRPLTELANTATLISNGDLEQTAKVERDDEVGTVARAFNTMTERLRNLVRNLERRTSQLRAINETGRHISSILHIDELLSYVTGSLQKTFNYHSVGILLIDPTMGNLVLKSSAGGYEGAYNDSQSIELKPAINTVTKTGEALLINNLNDGPDHGKFSETGRTRAEMAVPIKIGDRMLGILDIEADHTGAFDELDLFTAQTLADQLAVALENARLYEEAEELATMKERQRLARDLHDAVSQTLFSSSLIAEVLPKLWEKNPEEGRKRLEEIRQLTRGALAEMRTLLLELRPAALMDAELGDLLRQLAESITGRARIPVTVEVKGHCAPSPEVKVALYRIAQEALNNVAKHSGATRAKVDLNCRDNGIDMLISDNGKGFNPRSTRPDSLGLDIMRERARGIGASVDIESHSGQGTQVIVVWDYNQEEGNQ